MTNESRLPVVEFTPKNDTVVSKVFGKFYSNISAKTGSARTSFTSAMISSMIVELNFRSAGAGRLGGGRSLVLDAAESIMVIAKMMR